jgi:DNA-binding transcriptional LysR family regulator
LDTVRISREDLEMAWKAVFEAHSEGTGAFERVSQTLGVSRAVVMHAVDRVERSFGGAPFFVEVKKRTGRLTRTGEIFLAHGATVLTHWQQLDAKLRPGEPADLNDRDGS